jgi:protein-disulfide isomerase/uncharacterized membrane protein
MPLRRSVLLVLVAALAGTLLSGLLLLQHYNQAHDNALVSMICGGSGKSGCEAVDESPYSMFLGIPLAVYGILFYVSLAIVAGLSLVGDQKAKEAAAAAAFALAVVAFGVDLVLLGLQAFAVGAFCLLCISTYAATLMILVVTWKYRSLGLAAKFGALAASPAGGRLLLAAWAVGIALAGAGALATNYALSLADPTTFDQRLADIAFDEYRQAPLVAIDTDGAPSVGPEDAPIKIVVFSDFLCPWCKQVAENLQQNFPKWNDKVAVYYKSFPLDKFCNPSIGKTLHPGSCWMALGGVCAAAQGKFWEYHDAVYADQPTNPDGHDALVLAAGAGLDTVQMKQCMMQIPNQGKVRALIKQAASLGVSGTPVIFINGRRLPRFAYFSYVLRRESERLGLPTLGGLDD